MYELGLSLLHVKSPWVAAAWSSIFPGCGHLLQGRIAKGLTLVIWELVVNTNAKVDLGILYTFIGQFDTARHVVNIRWLLLYAAMYVYAISDSYRGTVDGNKLYLLAEREDAPVQVMAAKAVDINYLEKRSPWVAAAWSILSPGLGHLFMHRVIVGVFFIAWTITVIYFSHALEAFQFTMTGNFARAKSVLDMQWLMFLPSIYGFTIYDSYMWAVEDNKLFEKEQSRWLKGRYQSPDFKMPV